MRTPERQVTITAPQAAAALRDKGSGPVGGAPFPGRRDADLHFFLARHAIAAGQIDGFEMADRLGLLAANPATVVRHKEQYRKNVVPYCRDATLDDNGCWNLSQAIRAARSVIGCAQNARCVNPLHRALALTGAARGGIAVAGAGGVRAVHRHARSTTRGATDALLHLHPGCGGAREPAASSRPSAGADLTVRGAQPATVFARACAREVLDAIAVAILVLAFIAAAVLV